MRCTRITWFFRHTLCLVLLSSAGCLGPGEKNPTPGKAAACPRLPLPWIVADSAVAEIDAVRVRCEAERLAAALVPLTGPLPGSVSPPWRVHVTAPDTIPPSLGGPHPPIRRTWTGFTRWDAHEAWIAAAPGDAPETLRRLRHELTHVLIASTVGSGPDFPLWLQEGVPCSFETGVLPNGTPRDNRRRRRQLKALLRARRGRLDITHFLTRRADQPVSSNDYATAWGLVYALAANQIDPDGSAWLKACLEAAARASRSPGHDVVAAVRDTFINEMTRRGWTIERWSRVWRRRILRP